MADDIVVLHGALGAAAQMAPLAERLAEHGPVHVVELEGHGATPPADEAFGIERFAASVVAALNTRGLARAALFGYSMGGYVALHLAATMPERVARVVTLGTKFRWDPELAEREAGRLDPATIRAKVPRFAEALEQRHAGAGGWERVLLRTAALLRGLGARPLLDDDVLGTIRCPVRVIVGDRDATVSVEETTAAWRALGSGELAVLPRTPHPIEQVDVALLAAVVRVRGDA